MTTAVMIMVIPILNICPTDLIVLITAEATPKYLGTTELIIAFELGEENKAKPTPKIIRIRITAIIDVPLDKKAKASSPNKMTAIPAEAKMRGSTLSDSLPAKGESTV